MSTELKKYKIQHFSQFHTKISLSEKKFLGIKAL